MKRIFGFSFLFLVLISISIFAFRIMECRWVLLDNYGNVDYYKVVEADISDSHYVYDVHIGSRHCIVEIQNDNIINEFEF